MKKLWWRIKNGGPRTIILYGFTFLTTIGVVIYGTIEIVQKYKHKNKLYNPDEGRNINNFQTNVQEIYDVEHFLKSEDKLEVANFIQNEYGNAYKFNIISPSDDITSYQIGVQKTWLHSSHTEQETTVRIFPKGTEEFEGMHACVDLAIDLTTHKMTVVVQYALDSKTQLNNTDFEQNLLKMNEIDPSKINDLINKIIARNAISREVI